MPVTQSDIDTWEARGAAIRKAGGAFFDNPFIREPERVIDLEEWYALGTAWGNGWLREDDGRTPSVRVMLRSIELR